MAAAAAAAIKVMFKVELASYHQGDRSFRVVKPCVTRLYGGGARVKVRSAFLFLFFKFFFSFNSFERNTYV